MKRKIAILASGIVLAAAVWLLLANHDSTTLPVYEGKTAKEWLYVVGKTNPGEAVYAFRQMGPKSVPYLVQDLQKKDSTLARAYQWTYRQAPQLVKPLLTQPEEQERRWFVVSLALQGVKSRAAIPLLLQHLPEWDDVQQIYALEALARLVEPGDTNCIPPLTVSLRSKDFYVCYEAALVLQQLYSENLAISPLTNFLASNDPRVRALCLKTLVRIDPTNAAKWQNMVTNEPTPQKRPKLPEK